jgi:hypothetical protein
VKVKCDVNEVELEGDYDLVESVSATCGRCGHTTESYGTSDASVRRCLVMLREECPRGERNFYVADTGADDPEEWEPPHKGDGL